MTLTWADVERQFGAECVVAFDRDIAPRGFQVVLRMRGDDLWADDADCVAAHASTLGECRCVMWNMVSWETRREMRIHALQASVESQRDRHIAMLNNDLAMGRVRFPQEHVWRREYLGQWMPVESDAPDSE